jgi:hypothetical protein
MSLVTTDRHGAVGGSARAWNMSGTSFILSGNESELLWWVPYSMVELASSIRQKL